MITIGDIREGIKKLRGESLSGREWEQILVDGHRVWVDTNANKDEKPSRPKDWRKDQTRRIIRGTMR